MRKFTDPTLWGKNGAVRSALRISLIYFVCTGLWVLLSDQLIAAATRDFDELSNLQTYKGLFFVSSTSLLLYLLLRHEFLILQRAKDKLIDSERQMRALSAAEREQRTLAEALRDTTITISSTLDLSTVFDRILDGLSRVVPHDAAKIMLIRPGAMAADTASQRIYQPQFDLSTEPLSLEIPSVQTTIESGKPLLVRDTQTYDGWVERPLEGWIRSLVTVPIRIQDEVIGLLSLDSHTPNFFDHTHAERLQSFANQCAIAIKNAQLYAEVLREADDLEQRVQQRTIELNRAKEQVETILDSTSDAILLISPILHIQQTNPAFQRTFLYEVGDIPGQPLSVIAHPESSERLTEAVQAVAADQTPRRIEMTAQTKTGESFEADIALSPSLSESGHLLGIVCSVRDISAHKQMEAQLRKMLEHEMELNDLRSKFVSMLSHEFRTPLTVIRVSVDMLQKYNARLSDEHKQQEYDRVRTGIRQMTDLLEDVLTLSRSQSGMLKFTPTEFVLDEYCQEVLQEIKTSTDGSHIFQYSCNGQPGTVWLDKKLLRHILGNLLTNAVKYSPEGSTVHVNVGLEDSNIMLTIRDEGSGIPEEAISHLFEPFYRAKNAETVIGSGLGLAIVKQAVDLHQGTISVESVLGQGSVFRVVLPVSSEPISD